jgi:hypothetical protein
MGYLGYLRIETACFDAQIIGHLLIVRYSRIPSSLIPASLVGIEGYLPLKKLSFPHKALGKERRRASGIE